MLTIGLPDSADEIEGAIGGTLFFTPGTRLGPCEVLTQIGARGMDEVYKATDPARDRLNGSTTEDRSCEVKNLDFTTEGGCATLAS